MTEETINQIPKMFMGITFATYATAAVILAVGIIAIKCIARAISSAMERAGHFDMSLQKFLLYVLRAVLYFVLVIICATHLGLPVNSLLALLGTLGLAVSLALQDALKNVAGGIFLLFSRPFATGDVIGIDGVIGTVEEIGITHTVVLTENNKRVHIPNGKTSSLTVTNHSMEASQCIEIIFTVPYKSDIALAKNVISKAVCADKRVHDEPAVSVRVWELSSASVSIMMRCWCDAAESTELRCALLEGVKAALDSAEV